MNVWAYPVDMLFLQRRRVRCEVCQAEQEPTIRKHERFFRYSVRIGKGYETP